MCINRSLLQLKHSMLYKYVYSIDDVGYTRHGRVDLSIRAIKSALLSGLSYVCSVASGGQLYLGIHLFLCLEFIDWQSFFAGNDRCEQYFQILFGYNLNCAHSAQRRLTATLLVVGLIPARYIYFFGLQVVLGVVKMCV